MNNETFKTSFGFELSLDRVIEEIVDFIKEDTKRKYSVIVGTDSEIDSDKNADFVTAIVVHRKGNGGRYFWRRIRGAKFHTLRDRLIHEVVLSLESGKMILNKLKEQEVENNWSFEIHADVGDFGPSKAVIQEVVGMIRANNFEAKTKPFGYVASKVADRYC